MRHAFHLLMLMALLGLSLACQSTGGSTTAAGSSARENQDARPSVPTYTAYNLWFEKPGNFYSTGYHAGRIIPAGSQVMDVRVNSRKNEITFIILPEGVNYKMEFVPKHHPGLSIDQFMARLFTVKSLGQLTEGFSESEMAAVKKGTLTPGMSKKAVIVAFGYPIETFTPSLQSNPWTYMMTRFQRKVVNFDEQGLTTRAAVSDSGSL